MYCPQCAAQNIEGAKFCRACGADLRLVSQALKGSLPSNSRHAWPDEVERVREEQRLEEIERAAELEREEKLRPPARIDQGIRDIFKGIGFLCAFIIGMVAFRGAFWWTIWFVIPAFKNIGEGIGEIIRARQAQARLTMAHAPLLEPASPAPPRAGAARLNHLSSLDTAEMLPTVPASVTETTTRHLDAPLARRARDV